MGCCMHRPDPGCDLSSQEAPSLHVAVSKMASLPTFSQLLVSQEKKLDFEDSNAGLMTTARKREDALLM
ncbi:unnamed protein product [Protopolystoma xenopodis]|uniref:Uncharacterized protein n=1 Tax=Protopolystoma xenopodis TaxID=117903 RepID=A0A448XK29_9PLAT|nr:unnamed protein product [Protopolystoma xenopodis]